MFVEIQMIVNNIDGYRLITYLNITKSKYQILIGFNLRYLRAFAPFTRSHSQRHFLTPSSAAATTVTVCSAVNLWL